MDDYVFPSYSSSKIKSRHTEFGESESPQYVDYEFGLNEDIAGDAFVRELDVSRITLRLKEKQDRKGDNGNEEHTMAKLHGNTVDILQRCLVSTLALSD